MADLAAHDLTVVPAGLTQRLRRNVALNFAIVIVAACAILFTILISRALGERQAILYDATSAASALSLAYDQEVAAVQYLLKGLSTSPALRSGDMKAFYDQLKATPVPDGSWLIVNDLERQLINTLLPYGDPSLPPHSAFPTAKEAIARIRERGWSVSGRRFGVVKRAVVIALSLRIDGPDGEMRNWITTILSDERLNAILRNQQVEASWTKALYDRNLDVIIAERAGKATAGLPVLASLAPRLAEAGPNNTTTGLIESVDEAGVPVAVAYRHSGASNWTTAVAVPLSVVNAPVTAILWDMAWPAALLLTGGGAAALLTARRLVRPLQVLSQRVSAAEGEVTQLSAQLLAVQEEERQRIARELHDSTAQHIAAANIGLMRLEAEIQQGPSARKAFAQVENLLERALLELRVFTYLLHPPNLATDGLKLTLQEFIEGFAERTGLSASVRISPAVNTVSPDMQRSILRVVQEALSNVHRHAGATRVIVGVKMATKGLIIRVRDNGRGMNALRGDGSAVRPRLGVGISGMRARVQQFGGDLKISTGAAGTALIAFIPMSAHPATQARAAA